MKKILILNYEYPPLGGGAGNALYYMLQEFKDLKDVSIDVDRVAKEVAFLLEKADVTEEIVRLKSHIKLFRETMKKESPCGKDLDFLTQEMY